MVETFEKSYTIINLKDGRCIEEEMPNRLKTREVDFNNIKKVGQKKETYSKPVINEMDSYVEDKSIYEKAEFGQPKAFDKTSFEYKNEEFAEEKTMPVEEKIIEQPVIKEFEKPITDEVKEETVNSYGTHYEPTKPVPSITANALNNQAEKRTPSITTTSSVIDKINQPKEQPIKNDMDVKTFLSSLPNKDKLGPTANKVLDSEIPSLDKIIQLLEKLKIQIEDLKNKKEEKEAKKQEVLDGSKSLEEFLGMTLTLDLTAIKNATKGIDGAGEAFEDFKKSVGKIQNAKSSSDETIRQIEEDIRQIEEDIIKTQKEIEETKQETNNKCIKLQEDLNTARSLDEKEDAVNKQLDILRKQKEALTGTLPQYDPFANLREQEETETFKRAA